MAKVLLVEDDNNLREIYEARLQAEGYEIVSASDGEQALAIAKDAKPDLVISDVMMPKISGFEMLDILRNTDGMKDVKVIMLTALGQAEDKTRADQLGANRYLVKSQVTLEDIVKSAHQLLDDEPVGTPAPSSEPAAVPASVAPPVSPVASPPATTPDPVATTPDVPGDTTAPATPSTPLSAVPTDTPAAAASDDAKTTAQEEADMAAQITTFEQQPAAAPPEAAPEPAAAETASATPTPAASAAPTDNDKTMADAVDSLTAASAGRPSEITATEVAPEPVAGADAAPTSTPPAATTVSEPAPEPAAPTETVGNGTTVGHKKIITPINDIETPKTDINALLAAEEAKEQASQAAQASVAQPAPVVTAPPAPAPAPQVSTPVTPPPVAPAPPVMPVQESPADADDPSNIAL